MPDVAGAEPPVGIEPFAQVVSVVVARRTAPGVRTWARRVLVGAPRTRVGASDGAELVVAVLLPAAAPPDDLAADLRLAVAVQDASGRSGPRTGAPGGDSGAVMLRTYLNGASDVIDRSSLGSSSRPAAAPWIGSGTARRAARTLRLEAVHHHHQGADDAGEQHLVDARPQRQRHGDEVRHRGLPTAPHAQSPMTLSSNALTPECSSSPAWPPVVPDVSWIRATPGVEAPFTTPGRGHGLVAAPPAGSSCRVLGHRHDHLRLDGLDDVGEVGRRARVEGTYTPPASHTAKGAATTRRSAASRRPGTNSAASSASVGPRSPSARAPPRER